MLTHWDSFCIFFAEFSEHAICCCFEESITVSARWQSTHRRCLLCLFPSCFLAHMPARWHLTNDRISAHKTHIAVQSRDGDCDWEWVLLLAWGLETWGMSEARAGGHWLGCSLLCHGCGDLGLLCGQILECYHCSAGIFYITTNREGSWGEEWVWVWVCECECESNRCKSSRVECVLHVKCLQNKCGTWIRKHLFRLQPGKRNLIKLNLFNQISGNQH